MELLRVKNLNKKYSKNHILKDINLTINNEEIVMLVGANGSGKTTLMKCISNLLTIDRGLILINGITVNDNREKYLSYFSSVIEIPSFYESLTGMDNLRFIARLNRISEEEIEEVISFLNIQHFVNKPVHRYSLGMKQKLAIGMALIQNPSLIILDEPTNGLDIEGVMEFRELILKMKREKKISFLISTHIVSEIKYLGDRILFIKEGKIIPMESLNFSNNIRCITLKIEDTSKAYEIISKLKQNYEIKMIDGETMNVMLEKEKITLFIQHLVQEKIQYYDMNIIDYSFEYAYKSIY